jgi:hypothetical protein
MKKKLAILAATAAVATLSLAAGPASAEDVVLLLDDRFEDRLEHGGFGDLAYSGGREHFG